MHQRQYIPNLGNLATWSSDLAYFLGLFIADGNVQTATGQVSFVSTDESNTRFVANFLARDVPIRTAVTVSGKTAYRVSLWSKDVVHELARHGIADRKSFNATVPNMPAELRWDFLRGLIDGDGYVAPDGRIEIVTASAALYAGLASLLRDGGLAFRLVNSKRPFFRISLRQGPSAVLADLMYRQGGPGLERKRARLLGRGD